MLNAKWHVGFRNGVEIIGINAADFSAVQILFETSV
jgi:hypothetical protein